MIWKVIFLLKNFPVLLLQLIDTLKGMATALSISVDWKELKFYMFLYCQRIVKMFKSSKWAQKYSKSMSIFSAYFEPRKRQVKAQKGAIENHGNGLQCSYCELNPAEVVNPSAACTSRYPDYLFNNPVVSNRP